MPLARLFAGCIVDGQQRLTTFLLMLIKLYQVPREVEQETAPACSISRSALRVSIKQWKVHCVVCFSFAAVNSWNGLSQSTCGDTPSARRGRANFAADAGMLDEAAVFVELEADHRITDP